MMLYKTTDKITITIDKIEIKVSPLSQAQKMELSKHMVKAVSGDMEEAMISVRKSLSFCLKDIKGVFYMDGEDKREYQLSFADNVLTDECLDDLLNLPISNKLNAVCTSLLQGIPNEIRDNEGNIIEGIKIKKAGDKPGKQKK